MGGPKGINWEQALEFYLIPDSEGRIPSYQDVADKFSVSKKEVGLRAKRENWLQRRQNVYDTAEEAALAYDEAAILLHGKFVRTNAMLGLFGEVAAHE